MLSNQMNDKLNSQPLYNLKGKRIWVSGHRGMVGAALSRQLKAVDCEILTVDRADLDLRRQADVERWIYKAKPQAVFIAAATVGGIQANNTRPGEFLYDNAAIALNVIDAAYRTGVEKLVFLGSSCIYPRLAPQPMQENSYLTGRPEPTNEAYAIAKFTGIGLCQGYRRQYGCDFISVVPANIYGPGDNLDPNQNHVVPALIRKIMDAKKSGGAVEIWGTGTPRREFMYVDDVADALIFLMERYSMPEVINVGCGEDISVRELAETIAEVLKFRGKFSYDATKPDGMPLRRVDAERLLALGWRSKTSLREGLVKTCDWIASLAPAG
jgi:GDP-L-fucose synthase